MGLDQYLYKMKKLSESKVEALKGKTVEDLIADCEVTVVYERDFWEQDDTEFEAMVGEIEEYLTRLETTKEVLNLSRLRKTYGIPDEWRLFCTSYSGDGIEMRFGGSGEEPKVKDFRLSNNELKPFWDRVEAVAYVCDMREEKYWRKNYELQDKMYELADDPIQNCGFYLVNDHMAEAIWRYGGHQIPKDDDEYVYVYHEWY